MLNQFLDNNGTATLWYILKVFL